MLFNLSLVSLSSDNNVHEFVSQRIISFFQIIENMKTLTIIVNLKSWFASKHSTETAISEACLLTVVYSETKMVALSRKPIHHMRLH